jgi:cytochrome c551/c552
MRVRRDDDGACGARGGDLCAEARGRVVIELGERLVQREHGLLLRLDAREARPTSLARGQALDGTVELGRRQSPPLERRVDVGARTAAEARVKAQVLPGRETTQEHRALSDKEDIAVHAAPPSAQRHESSDRAKQGRLAGAVRPADERQPGREVDGQCAEDAAVVQDYGDVTKRDGAAHRRMMGRVVVLCTALAVIFVACAPEPPATEPIARGRQVYRQIGCGSCHDPNFFGQRVGPPLDHIGTAAATRIPGVAAQEYIRQSILDPGSYVVPGYPDSMPRGLGRDLSPTDLDALVAYLSSLK